VRALVLVVVVCFILLYLCLILLIPDLYLL